MNKPEYLTREPEFIRKNTFFWIKIILLYCPFFLLLLALRAKCGHAWGSYEWINWSLYDFKNGIIDTYNSWTDCLPIYHLIFFLGNNVSGGFVDIESSFWALRSVSLFFELGSTLILFKLLFQKWHRPYNALLYSLFYFLNVAVVYCTLIWGSLDVAMTFFLFSAVICGYKKKLLSSFILYFVAINFKLQAIIFLPLMLLIWIPLVIEKKSYKKIFFSFFTILTVNILLYLPFLLSPEFSGIWNDILNAFNTDSFVSKGAFNIWNILFLKNPAEVAVQATFVGISYKIWGWIFFIIAFSAMMGIILRRKKLHGPAGQFSLSGNTIFISFALTTLLFFFLNTEISGRELHPVFIFLAGYAMLYRKPWPFILISVAYFLNMEAVYHFMQNSNYSAIIYQPWFVVLLYLSVILTLYYKLIFPEKNISRIKKYHTNSLQKYSNQINRLGVRYNEFKLTSLYYWIKVMVVFIPFVVLLLFLKNKNGNWWDVGLFSEWAKYSFTHGLPSIYESGTDYMPIYNYILYIFGQIQGDVEKIWHNIHHLKNITILCEFGTTLFLFKFLQDKWQYMEKAILFSLFYFLNMAVIHNWIWGQVDGILTFFVVGAVIFALKKKLFPSLLFFLLAINFKLQAIIFLPIVGILLLPLLKEKGIAKRVVLSFFALSIILVLIYLPFIFNGQFSHIWEKVIIGSVGRYSLVSLNAYNIWYLLLDVDPYSIQNTVTFLGITYKNWGFILFFTASFFALFPFIKPLYNILFRKINIPLPEKQVWICAALIPLIFFFFNVEMHERYSHPAIIFIAFYSFLYKKPLPYIMISVAYFLNMEAVFQYFEFSAYTAIIFKPGFIGTLYLILIIILYLDLYNVKIKPFQRNGRIRIGNQSSIP